MCVCVVGVCLEYLKVPYPKFAKDKTGNAMKALYRQYVDSNEDWWSSTVIVRDSHTSTDVEGGRNAWLCRAESVVLFMLICFWSTPSNGRAWCCFICYISSGFIRFLVQSVRISWSDTKTRLW